MLPTTTRIAAAGLLAAASAAHASPLTAFEGFEAVPIKDASLASLNTAVGLFAPAAGFNVFVASPGYTNFGPGLNPTTSSILTANGDEHFRWTLAFAAATVSLEVYLNDLGPATLSSFDAGDVLLGTFNFAADADATNNRVNVNFNVGANLITRATFDSTLGGRLNTGLDNISIGQAGQAVPEPGSLALALAALGAMAGGGIPRRRRAAAVTA